jgi:hypothetical protein
MTYCSQGPSSPYLPWEKNNLDRDNRLAAHWRRRKNRGRLVREIGGTKQSARFQKFRLRFFLFSLHWLKKPWMYLFFFILRDSGSATIYQSFGLTSSTCQTDVRAVIQKRLTGVRNRGECSRMDLRRLWRYETLAFVKLNKASVFFIILSFPEGLWKHEVAEIRKQKGLPSGRGGWDIWVRVLCQTAWWASNILGH